MLCKAFPFVVLSVSVQLLCDGSTAFLNERIIRDVVTGRHLK